MQTILKNIRLRQLSGVQVQEEIDSLSVQMIERYQGVALITQSVKSIVCAARCNKSGVNVILKKFFDRGAYDSEIEGYLIFRGGPIANLLFTDASSCVIVFEKAIGTTLTSNRENFYLAVKNYAAMHAQAIANLQELQENLRSPVFLDPFLLSRHKHADISYQAVSVGDSKPGHLISSGDRLTIVDLETYSLQRSVWYDVLSLSRFMVSSEQFHSEFEEFCAFYCECRQIEFKYFNVRKLKSYLNEIQHLGRAEG